MENKWRIIYEVIDDLLFEKGDYFTDEILKYCKQNANITRCIPSETKKIIKAIAIEGGLYLQVVMIHCPIIKIKGMTEDSAKKKYKNNESSTNSQI